MGYADAVDRPPKLKSSTSEIKLAKQNFNSKN